MNKVISIENDTKSKITLSINDSELELEYIGNKVFEAIEWFNEIIKVLDSTSLQQCNIVIYTEFLYGFIKDYDKANKLIYLN